MKLIEDDVEVQPDTRVFEEGLVDSMNLVKLLFISRKIVFEVNIPVSMVNDENLACIDAMVELVNRVKS